MNNNEVLHGCSNVYLVGSHMYGLSTPDSDEDYVQIYFDRIDYIRPFPLYPDEHQTSNNNYKLYSLRKYATLVVKGNPNIVELVHETPLLENCDTVSAFTECIKEYVVHKGLVAAMLGHINHLNLESLRKGVTPKRLGHGLRLAETLKHVLLEKELVPYKQLSEARYFALGVKLGEIPLSDGEKRLRELITDVSRLYGEAMDTLPDSSTLRATINSFFKELYYVC